MSLLDEIIAEVGGRRSRFFIRLKIEDKETDVWLRVGRQRKRMNFVNSEFTNAEIIQIIKDTIEELDNGS